MVDCQVLLVTGYQPRELSIFSGHHPGIRVIRYCLNDKIRDYVENGTKWIVISGQAGIELWTGEVCLELKKDYPDLKLAVLIPFLHQEAHYSDWMQQAYAHVLAAADYTAAISRRPYESPAQLRNKNRFLVAKTDGLLMVYDEEQPGSPDYFLRAARREARRRPYPIRLIDRFDLEEAAEECREMNPDDWQET